ncbi:cyclin N-terminal domain-containing protein 1 isoform X2 [Rousettus aegyptiacus]|uniref:Cyclin N-terminal domain containing 1 n=1 Tax=Rousettus aegyptiacus TaxID=9407 RepID=A0A7J8G5W6_ROUAE|nr:cyclin N-terminal domain-containing protein 1 isoform X2 [Rousettus aegyptiacus]KAF6455423.1 cyclin N-terminal domain containing 1 [Rousettus aegyptiacus]
MNGRVRPKLASLSDFQFGAVATETIEDVLLHLAQQNEQAVQEAAGRMGSFRETRIVEFVFLLSEQWCLEKSVSYQAVEILERFMVKQAENICRQATTQLREKTEPQNWRALKEQLFNKFILRLVSCVQLASKLSFHYKALGYIHTKEELLESELDVLKSLNFQINLPTPLAYVEMLLEVLGYNGCSVPATRLHATCLTLLDLVYLLHEPVYESLLRASIENSTPSQLQGEKFVSVKEDFMLLAVGIIAASAFIQNHECWSQVVGHLQSITGIALESIAAFSYAILTHSVGANTPGRQQSVPSHLAARALRATASSNM